MSKGDFTETRLRSRLAFEGKLLRVEVDEVRLPDGTTAVREHVVHPGAVVMIAFVDERRLLLERQYRYPLGRELYELPAGKIDPGEDPLCTAERELREETGYRARSWVRVATLHPCVGYSNERLIYYLARDLSFEGERPDQGEFLEAFPLDLNEALEWVRTGRITDGKSVAGLFWAEKILRGDWPLPEPAR
jgi:ADP-ribose pyrophosphatase